MTGFESPRSRSVLLDRHSRAHDLDQQGADLPQVDSIGRARQVRASQGGLPASLRRPAAGAFDRRGPRPADPSQATLQRREDKPGGASGRRRCRPTGTEQRPAGVARRARRAGQRDRPHLDTSRPTLSYFSPQSDIDLKREGGRRSSCPSSTSSSARSPTPQPPSPSPRDVDDSCDAVRRREAFGRRPPGTT